MLKLIRIGRQGRLHHYVRDYDLTTNSYLIVVMLIRYFKPRRQYEWSYYSNEWSYYSNEWWNATIIILYHSDALGFVETLIIHNSDWSAYLARYLSNVLAYFENNYTKHKRSTANEVSSECRYVDHLKLLVTARKQFLTYPKCSV